MMAAPDVVNIFQAADYDGQIDRAARVLREGGVAVLPTETVYGAAGVLTRPEAVARLRARRGADDDRPLTIHLAHRAQAAGYLGELTEAGRRLMQKLWPGPVGLTFDVPDDRRREVAGRLGVEEREIYAADGSITLRCPDHIVAADVIARCGDEPVVVTAAGQGSGVPSADDLADQADLIIDAGPTRYSKPSTLLKVTGDGYEIVRSGVYDARIIERLLRTTILFVCSGNTCRSPMSEALARQALAQMLGVTEDELEQKGYTVLSAGSFAMPGARAAAPAVEALRGMGVDLSRHRSRPLSVELIHQADVIFAMSRGHVGAVTALVPSAGEKTVLLDPEGDIEDPIGADVAHYQTLAGTLRELVTRRLGEVVGVERGGDRG